MLIGRLGYFRYAIKGSPKQKLLLEDIYYAIESRVRVCFSATFVDRVIHQRAVPILQDGATRVEGEPVFLNPLSLAQSRTIPHDWLRSYPFEHRRAD